MLAFEMLRQPYLQQFLYLKGGEESFNPPFNNFLLLKPLFNIIEEWLRLLLLPTNFQKPELPIQF
jgi:hypothetical protein